MAWKIEKALKAWPKLDGPVLIEGLPGIGNVGKVAVDFIIAELKAEKLCSFFSYSLPNSVFVNENNLVELPTIEMYYKKRGKGKRDLIFLAGDIQPTNEEASYEFCDVVLDVLEQLKCTEIVTLGGIGLANVSKTPKVYCTGNEAKIVKDYVKQTGMNSKLYGVVGPIVGATGLFLGLAKKRGIPAIAILAETLAHTMYLGIRGGREIIKVLDKRLSIGINLAKLEEDIKDMESDMMKKGEMEKASRKMKAPRKETSYIG